MAPTFTQNSSFNIVDKHIRGLISEYGKRIEGHISAIMQLSQQHEETIKALMQKNKELEARLAEVENKTFSRATAPVLTTSIEDDRRARIKEKIRNG